MIPITGHRSKDSSFGYVLVLIFLIFLSLIFIPETSIAQIKDCQSTSTAVIATDGGNVNLSSLSSSVVASFNNNGDPADSVIQGLSETCGYTSVVSLNGNAVAIPGSVSKDKSGDVLSLDEALLEACNYSAVLVEIVNEDNCSPAEFCTDDNGYLWADNNGYLWVDNRGYLWAELACRGYLWAEGRGYLWAEGRGASGTSVRIIGFSEPDSNSGATPWISNNGYLWVD